MSQPELSQPVERYCALTLAISEQLGAGNLLDLSALIEIRQSCLDEISDIGNLSPQERAALANCEEQVRDRLRESKSVLLSEIKQVSIGMSSLSTYAPGAELRSYDAAG